MPLGRPLHHGRGRREQARPRFRHRHLWALLVVPVLIAAGVYLVGGPGGADAPNQAAPGRGHTTAAGPSPASTRPGSVTDVQGAAACAPVSSMSAPCSVGGARVVKMSARTSGGPANPGSAGRPAGPAGPAPGSARGSTPPSSSASSPASSPAAARPVAAAAPQRGTPANQVLALINQARSQAGLPALTFSAGLDQSASAHNLTMANGCGLSHQCPGEPPIGTRETDAGVHWTSAGENIGEAGPEADTTAAIAAAAIGLTQDMLNEKPPDDGHRLNILSSSFTHIGIAVRRSSSGTVWLTQDFSN
jgi:uncharacterized protein YkwD